MDSAIVIACDSSADLSEEMIREYNIKVLPIDIILDSRVYSDGVDISPSMVYQYFQETGEIPRMSAINSYRFSEFFRRYQGEGKTVILFTISSTMSSTYDNACLAARDFDNVHVIDSRNLTSGIGLLVLKAADLAAAGAAAEEIVKTCSDLRDCVDTSFVIDTLDYLTKGGRCSSITAFSANILHIKPSIVLRNGTLHAAKMYRGKQERIVKKYTEDTLNAADMYTDRFIITHSGCSEEIINAVYELVESTHRFARIHITPAGCTISSHCGPNTLGVMCIRKTPVGS